MEKIRILSIKQVKSFRLMAIMSLLALIFSGCSSGIPDLKISPETLPEGIEGEAYYSVINVSGNDSPVYLITVNELKLPPGLTFTYKEGKSIAYIKGIPEKPGIYDFMLRVYCRGTQRSGQTAEKSFHIVIR